MSDGYIDMIEATPKLYLKRCKVVSFVLKLFLQYSTITASFIVWYFYDFFISMLTLALSFIIMGIIRSSLRNSSIPITQREYHYNDEGIADWYTATKLCGEFR